MKTTEPTNILPAKTNAKLSHEELVVLTKACTQMIEYNDKVIFEILTSDDKASIHHKKQILALQSAKAYYLGRKAYFEKLSLEVQAKAK